MKKIMFSLLALILALPVGAQSIEALKLGLRSPDPVTGKRASAVEHGSAVGAVKAMLALQKTNPISGYRVRIFLDNKQNARIVSADVVLRFKELFPDITVSRGYTEPYYRVTAGSCITYEEALVLWGKVKGNFEKAFIIRDLITMADLAEYNPATATVSDAEKETE